MYREEKNKHAELGAARRVNTEMADNTKRCRQETPYKGFRKMVETKSEPQYFETQLEICPNIKKSLILCIKLRQDIKAHTHTQKGNGKIQKYNRTK